MKLSNKKIFVFLGLLLSLNMLMACSQETPRSEEINNQPAESKNEIPDNSSASNTGDTALKTENGEFSMDKSQWKEVSPFPGVTFFHPPELKYEFGGDIDEGSSSELKTKNGEKFLTITRSVLQKCKFDDPAQCNVGTQMEATPEEVFKELLKSYDDLYTKREEVYLGKRAGYKFFASKNSGDPTMMILFTGSEGVFTINSSEDHNSDPLISILDKFIIE